MGYGPLNGKWLGPPWRKGLALRPSGREGFLAPAKLFVQSHSP